MSENSSASALSDLVERLKARRDETLSALPQGVRRATAQWVFDQEIAFLESGADEQAFQAAAPPRLVIEGQSPQENLKEHEELLLRAVMSRRIAPKLYGQRGLEKLEEPNPQATAEQTATQQVAETTNAPHRSNRNLTRV